MSNIRKYNGATSFTGDGLSNWNVSRVTDLLNEHVRTFSRTATSFTRRWIVKLGYVEGDEFGIYILPVCDLVHGRWIVKLGTHPVRFGFTSTDHACRKSLRGRMDLLHWRLEFQIGIRRV